MKIHHLLDYDGIAISETWSLPSNKSTFREKGRYNEKKNEINDTVKYSMVIEESMIKPASEIRKVFKAKMILGINLT